VSEGPQQGAEFLLGRLANEQEANRKLRALLRRAADRIYMWVDAGLDPSMETKELIGELRKAAE
jgi:hypothetical protein